MEECQILEHCWLWLTGWAEVPGLHHHVGEDGGGQSHSEVQLTKEGGHTAPWDQAPVRILNKHMSGEVEEMLSDMLFDIRYKNVKFI